MARSQLAGSLILFWLIAAAFTAALSVPSYHDSILGNAGTFEYQYYVQSHDTLDTIAQRFGLSLATLASANGIVSPYSVHVGEELQIPLTSTFVRYTVQSNDSIWSIAKDYEVYWASIAEANNLKFPFNVYNSEALVIQLADNIPMNLGPDLTSTPPLASECYLFNVPVAACTTSATTTSSESTWSSSSTFSSSSSSSTSSSSSSSTSSSSSSSTSGGGNNRHAWAWVFGLYPQSQMSAIKAHASNLTAVSPMEFFLANNGSFSLKDGSGNTYQNLCPQIHGVGLQCEVLIQNDQNNCSGILNLLSSTTLEQDFMAYTVEYAMSYGAQGVNLDFEPSNNCGGAQAYASFVSNLADALHENGMTLSVDIASFDGGSFWNFTLLGQSDVDLLITMDTYTTPFNASNCNYQWPNSFVCGFQKMYADVPNGKIGIGLISHTDDADLSQRFSEIDLYSSPYVAVWPYAGSPISSLYFNSFGTYLSGAT